MLKKLKGLFIIEDDAASVKEGNPAPQGVAPTEEIKEASIISPSVNTQNLQREADDPDFLGILLKSIEENNQEGFDYFELKQAVKSLDSMGLEEDKKYQSALAMGSTMGATPQKILASGTQYLQVLKKKYDQIDAAYQNQVQNRANQNKSLLEQYHREIQEKTDEIKRLQAAIEERQKAIQTMTQELESSQTNAARKHGLFIQAYEHVSSSIQNDLEIIKRVSH